MNGSLESYDEVLDVLDVLLQDGGRVETSGEAEPRGEGRPEVTVSMPARNAAPFLATAIRSVLNQEGIEVRLVVVDDASSDETARVARSFRDPRVTVFRNDEHRGIGFSHNRALEVAETPFIAHVDADDFVVPWALARMVAGLRERPGTGQAYCNFFMVGESGRISRAGHRHQVEFLRSSRRTNSDYRKALLVHGMVANSLRTYPTEVLREAGGFNEDLAYAVDYEMSVRIADSYDMVLVPDFLYFQRVHEGNAQQNLPFRRLRSWWTRTSTCVRLLMRSGGRLLGFDPLRTCSYLGLGLLHALGVPDRLKRLLRTDPLRRVKP